MTAKSGTVKPSAAARGDAYVADRLAHTQQRIRGLDLAVAGLVFIAGTCAYAAFMIAADPLLSRAEVARELLFVGYVVAAVAYLAYFVVRPLTLRVNPYFAARVVERTLPGAKNSVVNWVDLQGRALPAAIRNALGLRAAKDLSKADLDSAVSARTAGIAGGLAAAAGGVLFALLLWLGGGAFADGLLRAFAPFHFSGPARSRTQLTLVRPEAGNVTVPVGRSVAITVEVGGKTPDPQGPDAVRLLYRYGEGDPWLERPMTDEARREYTATVASNEVRSGFWYKVAGGDAETPEYRVSVRSTPQLVDFQATYHFPAYAAMPKDTRRERNLRAIRGSEVVLWALTNRTISEGHVDFEGKEGRKTIAGVRVPGDVQAFQVHLPLTESGRYRLGFTSADGDSFVESLQPVDVLDDKAPEVQLTKPGADVSLPANGLLSLVGQAADEFGVRELTLRMQAGDRTLKARPYRSAEALRLPGGGYPQKVDYMDAVDLAKLEADDLIPFRPQTGMEIEYWLEAADACVPKANVGASKHFRVKLTEPQKDEAKRQKDRDQAKQEQKQHEAKQDQQLKQESQDRQNKDKKADQQEQQPGKSEEQKDQGGSGGHPDKKDAADGGKGGETGQEKGSGAGGEQSKENSGAGANETPEQQKQDRENREKLDRLQEAHEKNQDKQDSSDPKEGGDAGKGQQGGDSKAGGKAGDQKPSAEKGNSPENKPEQGGNSREKGGDSNPASAKPDSKAGGEDSPKPGENKGEPDPKGGGKPGAKPDESKGRGGDNSPAGGQPKAEQKPGEPQPAGNSKPDGNDQGKKDSQGSQPKPNGTNEPGAKPEPRRENPNQPGANSQPQGRQDPRTSQEKPKPGNDPSAKNPSPAKEQSDPAKPTGDPAKPGNKADEDKGQNSTKPGDKKDAAPEKQQGSTAGKPDAKPDDPKNRGGNESPAGGQEGADKKPGENNPGDQQTPAGSKPQGKEGEKNAPPDRQPGSKGGKEKQPGAKPESKGDGSTGQEKQDKKEEGNAASGTGKKDPSKKEADKPGQGEARNAEKKPDGRDAEKDPKQGKPEDVRKAAKDLASNDPNKRAEAEKKLEDIRKNAKDAESREQARKALEQAKEPTKAGDSAGKKQEKPGDSAAGKQEKAGDKAGSDPRQKADKPGGEKADGGDPKSRSAEQDGGGGEQNGQRPGQKPGEKKSTEVPDGSKPGGKGNGAGEKGDQLGENGKQGEVNPEKLKGKEEKNVAGDNPGEGGLENRRSPEKNDQPPPPDRPKPDAKPRANKRTELQLEDLDKVTKKDLEAAKLTEKDLAALREWLREQQKNRPKADPKEATVAPQRGGEGGSFGGRRLQPGTGAKPNDLSGGNRPQPPPGYREANEAFKRLINKAEPEAPKP